MAAQTGKVSWFGGPSDPSTGNSTALGIPLSANPGIAVYNRATLGGFWLIKLGNKVKVVRQTDLGPAPWTGKTFDFSYNLLQDFGYTQANFPTGSNATGVYLGKSASDVSKTLGAALSQVGAAPSDINLSGTNPTPAQAQSILDQVSKQGSVGAKVSGNLNVTSPLSGLEAIVAFLTSTETWLRLFEAIAGIVLIAMGLRSLTGTTATPATAVAAAAKVIR